LSLPERPVVESNPSSSSKGVPSRAAIWKHPLHPAIAGFPVAFFTAALVTDLLFWRSADSFWADFSFWLILSGWLTGLASVLTGLIDFLTIERVRALRAGWIHFILTDLAVFLATFNLFARLEDRYGFVLFAGLWYSLVIAAFVLAGGFFGGRLVFRHLIGPSGPD
jgi:uncharacterized membrane protein